MSQIISGLTSNTPQQQPIVLPDGTTLTMTLTFRPQQGTIQGGWFVDYAWDGQSPPWQNNGMHLVTSPNVLRQYKNQLPFGLTVSTTDNQDPQAQTDFISGYCTLVLLDAADVIDIEQVFFPGH
jgi:hypothetical protein